VILSAGFQKTRRVASAAPFLASMIARSGRFGALSFSVARLQGRGRRSGR
jgi:hypothetical protein